MGGRCGADIDIGLKRSGGLPGTFHDPRFTSPGIILWAGHSLPVTALAFAPSGRLLATGSQDCTVVLWDLFTGLDPPFGNTVG